MRKNGRDIIENNKEKVEMEFFLLLDLMDK